LIYDQNASLNIQRFMLVLNYGLVVE